MQPKTALGIVLARLAGDRASRIYFLSVALVLTIAVGASRVYLGVHYPTDVLAGWAAGIVWALACRLVARYLQRRGAVEQPGSVGGVSSFGGQTGLMIPVRAPRDLKCILTEV